MISEYVKIFSDHWLNDSDDYSYDATRTWLLKKCSPGSSKSVNLYYSHFELGGIMRRKISRLKRNVDLMVFQYRLRICALIQDRNQDTGAGVSAGQGASWSQWLWKVDGYFTCTLQLLHSRGSNHLVLVSIFPKAILPIWFRRGICPVFSVIGIDVESCRSWRLKLDIW